MAADIIKLDAANRNRAVERAATVLAEGGLVVFPTETVYGVAANASRGAAVTRLRSVKGRAGDQPFTVHVGHPREAEPFLADSPPVGKRLMTKGWPGPLTLLFAVPRPEETPIHARLSSEGREAIYRNKSVGLRCPDDAATCALLTRAGHPIVASSANRAGRPPPGDADAAMAELGEKVDLVLDGGRTRYRKASTIVSLNGRRYEVVREGVWDARTIQRMAALNILFVCTGNTCRSPMAEGLCRDLLSKRLGCQPGDLWSYGVSVQSAGSAASNGLPAAGHAARVCRERGIDISQHRTHPLSADAVRSADYIFTMTDSHRRAVLDLAPYAADRVRALDDSGDIDDPVGGTESEYAECADRIAAALELRLKDVEL